MAEEESMRMEMFWETTPAELRVIAGMLEREGCNQVRVNWYHTRLCFRLPERDRVKPEPIHVIEGQQDGSIPAGRAS